MHAAGRCLGYVPEHRARRAPAYLSDRLSQGAAWILGVNGGSHGAGAALVRVEGGEARLVLNAEEERWSRRKHEWGFPKHALAEAIAILAQHGDDPSAVAAVACGWDFAAFAASFLREV